MKAWQKIVGLGLTTILILAFFIYSIVLKLKKVVDGFQTGTTGTTSTPGQCASAALNATPPAAGPDGLPAETADEKFAYDLFEYQNTDALYKQPPSAIPPWNPAGALTEYDPDAPIPWDMDNKFDDPSNILWGTVDRRCSQSLWERARMRYIFSSANNMDVDEQGQIGYWSAKFGGTIFHDPSQIAAVQFAEYLVDFAMEEVLESIYGKVRWKAYGSEIKAYNAGEKAGRDAVREMAGRLRAEGKTATKAEFQAVYKNAYETAYMDELLKIKQDEIPKSVFAKGKAAVMDTLSPIGKQIERIKNFLGAGVDSLFKIQRTPTGDRIPPAAKLNSATIGKDVVTKATARKVGAKAVGLALGKTAGRLAARLFGLVFKLIGALDFICAAVSAIPGVGQVLGAIICAIGFVISLILITVVPQILQDRTDLDQSPTGDPCAGYPYSGCDDEHPFNIQCAISKAISPTFFEVLIAIPYVGDALGAFGPFLCSNESLTSTVFRQSFRPPPYYFDSTLSFYFTDKPRLLDGGANGTGLADDMYRDPSVFKLPLDASKYYDNKDNSYWGPGGVKDAKLHPWVDYSHQDMLDKMANYYYGMSRRNQTLNFDGNAVFQYITCFRGCIASSQFSCDVQVEFNEITYDPQLNTLISETPVPNPYETIEVVEGAGCTFHDRRFYFTVDYTKAIDGYNTKDTNGNPKLGETIRNEVLALLAPMTSAKRLEAYRKMFIVVGCTNANGTAPDIIDNTEDGDFAGESSIGLGTPDYPFPLPKVNGTTGTSITSILSANINQFPDVSTDCRTVSVPFRYYGLGNVGGAEGAMKNSRALGARPRVVLSEERDYTAGLYIDLNAPTNHYTTFGPNKSSFTLRPYLATNGATSTTLNTVYPPTGRQKGDRVVVVDEQRTYILWDRDYADASTVSSIGSVSSYTELMALANPTDGQYAKITSGTTTTYYRYYRKGWVPIPLSREDSPKVYVETSVPLRWVPYNPMPLWPNYSTPSYLERTTKYWSVTPKERSNTQRAGGILQGGIVAALPLGFGFEGGLLATTLDATGLGNRLACLYQDTQKQTGDFILNGYLITNEDRFFMVRGPAIKFAPGYRPTYDSDLRCKSIPITSKVCANRRNIRLMAKRYRDSTGGTRRVKRITDMIPNPNDRSCYYLGTTVGTNSSDNSDIVGSEIPFAYQVTYGVSDKKLCSLVIDTARIPPTPLVLDTLPFDSADITPPLTQADYDTIKNLYPTNKELPRDPHPNTDFLRKTCANTGYANCGTDLVKEMIRTDFNGLYYKAAGDPASGSVAQIPSIGSMTLALTPKPDDVFSGGDPMCIYQTTVTVDRGAGARPETRFIRFTLESNPEDSCKYRIKSHDFPRNYFLSSIPKTGFLELPSLQKLQRCMLRSACSDEKNFGSCGSIGIIEPIVNTFNKNNANTGKKILRVNKAYGPILNDTTVCDYEVDMLRTAPDSRLYMNRETIRFYLEEDTKDACSWKYRGEDSNQKFNTGTSIDPLSDTQDVSGGYTWHTSVITGIRNTLNQIIGTFVPLNIPDTLTAATKDAKDRISVVFNTVGAGEFIQGCESIQTNCKSPEVLNAFIQRYGFDNWPSYPDGQFGSVRTRVSEIRRAGMAAPRECHIELIERQETFENSLKEPLPGTQFEYLNKRAFLRQYRFVISDAAVQGGKCAITPKPFTKADIQGRTFDISGEAYGINTNASTQLTDAERALIPNINAAKNDIRQNMISPWSADVLRVVIAAIHANRYGPGSGPPNLQSVRFESIIAGFSARPNVIEYRAFVTEVFSDPDFGQMPIENNYVIVSAEWNESVWNPVLGTWATGKVVAPTTFFMVNVDRSRIIRQDENTLSIESDGNRYENPPYLYFDIEEELDPTKDRLRIEYPVLNNSDKALRLNSQNQFITLSINGGPTTPFQERAAT